MTDFLIEGEVYQSKVKFINKGKFHCKEFNSEISCVNTENDELEKEKLYDE